jgi:predicted nuclease of predicted toxin-antitoxin system
MLRVFVDRDFDHDILRGLRLHLPNLDAITALHAGLDRKSDGEILAWAAAQSRVVVTHDRNTMPAHAYERVRKGEPMAGVFLIPQEMPVGKAISELEVLIACSLEGEWSQLVVFLPL